MYLVRLSFNLSAILSVYLSGLRFILHRFIMVYDVVSYRSVASYMYLRVVFIPSNHLLLSCVRLLQAANKPVSLDVLDKALVVGTNQNEIIMLDLEAVMEGEIVSLFFIFVSSSSFFFLRLLSSSSISSSGSSCSSSSSALVTH